MSSTATERLWIRGGACLTLDEAGRVFAAGEGDLLIEGERIVQVGRLEDVAGARVIDAAGCVVLPGLIQTHVHLCQTLFRGAADDLELLDWLEQRIWPLEAAHDAESLAASVDLGIAELLRGGTTTILDMATVHDTDVVLERVAASGLRYTGGKALMDTGEGVPPRLAESTRAALEETEALARRWHGVEAGRLRYAHCPRFILSCSDELLEGTRALVEEVPGVMMHTHAAENRGELAHVRRRTGVGNVRALGERGLLGEHSCLAHGIWLEDDECAELASTKTGICHCPSSNLKLGSGICDVPRLLQAGVRVGIGADGAPCNNNLDGFHEMRLAGLLQRPAHGVQALPAEKVVRMATTEGARILGLEAEIGSLEVGKRADVIVVDLDTLHTSPLATPLDEASLCRALVYATRSADVRHTVVDGRILFSDAEFATLDRERTVAEARPQITRCLQRAGLAR